MCFHYLKSPTTLILPALIYITKFIENKLNKQLWIHKQKEAPTIEAEAPTPLTVGKGTLPESKQVDAGVTLKPPKLITPEEVYAIFLTFLQTKL